MIDTDLWRKLEGFHPDFFMYGEDADLCLRAARHGAGRASRPRPRSCTTAALANAVRAGKMVRLFTAKAQLYKKFWGPGAARFGLFTLDLWAFVRRSAFGLLGLVGKGSPASREVWREIWSRRGEWHQAFRATGRYGK
ncbi:MAG: hypothetical protein R3E96_14550 [Planctomycetota bacterium]